MDTRTIKALLGQINKRGLANPNRFTAYFNAPQYVIDEVDGFDLISQQLLCESITFPGKQIESIDYSMYRNLLKMPSGYMNDELSVTFRLTEDFYVKKIFETWQAGIIDQRTYKARYLDEYVKDLFFIHEDKENKPKYKIRAVDCYPITVSAIEKSNETVDSALKLTVTFACRDIIHEPN